MRSPSGEITSLGAESECGASPSREWRYSVGSDVAMPVGMDESVGTSSSTGWATASGRNSFFSSDCSSSNWSSNRSSATSSDEGRKASCRPLLGAGLLELYPSGTIEKPRQYESEEWDNVMRENQRWPYPVEQQGLVILIRGMLSSCSILLNVLKVCLKNNDDSADKRMLAKLRDLVRQQLLAQDLHILVATTLVDALERQGLNVPGNILVLLRMQSRRQLAMGGVFQELERTPNSNTSEIAPLLRSIGDQLSEYFRGALTFARLEVEDLCFMLRKHMSHGKLQDTIEKKVILQNGDLCAFPVIAMLLGSLDPQGRSLKVSNVTNAPESIARVMGILYQRAYRQNFVKPAQTLINKYYDESDARPPAAPSVAWSDPRSYAGRTSSTATSSKLRRPTLELLNPKNLIRYRRGKSTEPAASPSQQQSRANFAGVVATGTNSGRFTT